MIQPKDIDWLIGYKNKNHIYVVDRDPLQTYGHIQTECVCVRGWKKIFHANGNQKKARAAILISDKIDFNRDYFQRQRRTLHNDQGINPRRRYNNCKYLRIQHRNASIHKANANNHKRANRK